MTVPVKALEPLSEEELAGYMAWLTNKPPLPSAYASDLLSALTELRQLRERVRWRDIKEAPRDGSRVLLCFGNAPGGQAWRRHPIVIGKYLRNKPNRPDAWALEYVGKNYTYIRDDAGLLTHFQHLPAPPDKEKGG